MTQNLIQANFTKALSDFKNQVDWVGLRLYTEKTTTHVIRNENPEEHNSQKDQGVMIEVMIDGHVGYAATSDLTPEGMKAAFSRAKTLSTQSSQFKVAEFTPEERPSSRGQFQSPYLHRLDTLSTEEVVRVLMNSSKAMKVSDKIVSRLAYIFIVETEIQYASSSGAEWLQNFDMVTTYYKATAQNDKDTQSRTEGNSLQIGAEIFRKNEIYDLCRTTGEEAMLLLESENCPTETMDILLAPDQMQLQIHESIGHPLELDRILGDERNYAGWSFIKPEFFGNLQYGSSLLNVVFDPSERGQFASYAFDDVGNPATREYLIKDGKLLRGLGSLESQKRSGILGVANQRASSWNRAPIDRMANINVVPGKSTLDEMIGSVKRGVLMKANRSWSIDDYRNKFQFGCEYGQMIEDGKLTRVVKNPNYRGKTLEFWNSLKAVGNSGTYENHGSPFCGKGEPSQLIRVAHSSPYCLFGNIEVFGGV
ncbi:TldD/PmbA family protein [Bdellovibrio sp. HCB337]|uniref:TldD/PmbA family protein n=1 Tax=Bdellovibrio sp. HCB337 TaxID=3394358 RepID=UPI0039A6FF8B